MKITGWGRYPVMDALEFSPLTRSDLTTRLENGFVGIARGMGRSYGDSALAPQVINSRYLNHILEFDKSTGIVRCEAGVSIADILNVFAHQGWFLPVTPGTKFVTVGGAIASDVHGKNHHIEGSFSEFASSITLMLGDGSVIICSRDHHPELFYATCGGMGLTGIILEITFKLKRIQSCYIHETTFKAKNVDEALELLDEHANYTYSVAWVDCMSTGPSLGRSLLMLGEHANDGRLEVLNKATLSTPFNMPGFFLNRHSIRAFNTLYYHWSHKSETVSTTHYEPFFYPLDRINNWNRIYGNAGFTQYQFVLPLEAGKQGISTILKQIADSRQGSFLSVLKRFGEANHNYLSFPMKGYTLALDFKLDTELFPLLDKLDQIVLDYGGRLYLTKDARMSEDTFKRGYPRWKNFLEVRRQYGADNVFRSLQSERLGI